MVVAIVAASLILGGAIIVAARVMDGESKPKESSSAPRSDLWLDEVDSALKNAATAEESFATSSGGLYTAEVSELEEEGLQPTENVTLVVIESSDLGYCIEAAHARLANVRHYSSDVGRPVDGACR